MLTGGFRTILLRRRMTAAVAPGLCSLSATVTGTVVTNPTFLSQNTRESKINNLNLEDVTHTARNSSTTHWPFQN